MENNQIINKLKTIFSQSKQTELIDCINNNNNKLYNFIINNLRLINIKHI